MKKGGMGSHQKTIGDNQEWITPLHILKPLGQFDLDPCSPIVPPWSTALKHYSILDNGLMKEWFGRVWMNPPYDRRIINLWMGKLAKHGNGISLTFNRSDTVTVQDYILEKADSMFLLRGRITFCDVYGNPGEWNGGAPSVLAAYGKNNIEALHNCGLPGKHILLKYTTVITVVIDRTWKTVISTCLVRLDGKASLSAIYHTVERVAPEKVRTNNNYRAKIRQQLQKHFERIQKGTYTFKSKQK